MGQGTERIEETLAELFPERAARAPRSRRACASAATWKRRWRACTRGEARILVGTQMVTKGHTSRTSRWSCVLNADQGLFSTDFRAAERLAQTIVQVAGRAGRGDAPGRGADPDASFPSIRCCTNLLAGGL